MFTKELSKSLIIESKKSSKPALDKERINKVFQMIVERFKDSKLYKKEWNPKTFISKANQKCRDSIKE